MSNFVRRLYFPPTLRVDSNASLERVHMPAQIYLLCTTSNKQLFLLVLGWNPHRNDVRAKMTPSRP